MKSCSLALCLALLAAGCSIVKPLRNPDALDNATGNTWAITADFASGLHHAYSQAPESFSDFGTMNRRAVPVLTSIAAVSKSDPPVTYSLSAADLARLRRAAPGGLNLVLFDEGIACLSPAMKKAVEQEVLKNYSREEYFRTLKAHASPALDWTRAVLGKR